MFRGLAYLWKFSWKSDKKYLFCAVALQWIRALIPLASVTFPKFIIDELTGAQRPDFLLLLAGAFLVVLCAANCLSNYLMLKGFNGRIRVANAFLLFMHKKLANADYASIQDPHFLDVKTKAEKFLSADWHGYFYLLDEALSLIGHVLTLAGVIAIMMTLAPWVAVVLSLLILGQIAVDAWAKKHEIAISLESAVFERHTMYYAGLFENAQYAKELRVNVLGDWLLNREKNFLQKGEHLYQKRNAFFIKSGASGAFSTFLQQSAAYAYVISKILSGQIGIGSFVLYTSAVNTFSMSMRSMINSFVWIKSYGKYYGALDEYLNTPETMRHGHSPVPEAPYTFCFENVGYRYPGQEIWALRRIHLTLTPGEKLSVVGENGAGKTTFIKLLMRLYDPTEGRITLNGIDIREIAYDAYMGIFGAVFQDFQLFAFPLRENVALANSDHADDAAIEDALKRSGFSGRLASLPDGLDTIVSRQFDTPSDFPSIFRQKEHSGFEPSGGEAQKIALARALFRNAPVAILDEPTAALDPRAEYEMYQQFDAMVAGKTAVYVSHRMSSARFCDRIAVFRDGEIGELGTHEELMEKDSHYAELYRMQARYYTS